jgi:predicted enzyme related to lactoylglutathione lyase
VTFAGFAGAVIYARDVERLTVFYSTVLGLQIADRDDEHVVLESPVFQLVVLRIPPHISETMTIAVPPVRRANAAIKPVFFVPSITAVRESVAACGGVMNAADQEWEFQGCTVCDGLDPEGNVVQFRERARGQ